MFCNLKHDHLNEIITLTISWAFLVAKKPNLKGNPLS